jgi:hypothetical protein
MKDVYIPAPKPCDLCRYEGPHDAAPGVIADAEYDCPDGVSGRWANMCLPHYAQRAAANATAVGYHLIVGEEPVRSDDETRALIADAIERGDADEVWDLVGDGDLIDFL